MEPVGLGVDIVAHIDGDDFGARAAVGWFLVIRTLIYNVRLKTSMEERAYEEISLESKDSEVVSCMGDAALSGVSIVGMLACWGVEADGKAR